MGTIAQKVQWTWDCKRDIEQALLERGIALPQDFRDFGDAIRSIGRKPYDSEVEYLESTGTQYIDTGVAVSDPSTIAIEADEDVAQPLGFTHQNVIDGTWVSRYSPSAAAGNLYIYYKDYSNRVIASATETRKTARWDGSSGYYENGASLASFVASVGSDSIADSNWLYGAVWDFNANAADFRSSRAGKIYGLKVEVSGVLVRDFIPVRKDGVGYLYDKVSGQLFGNAGTGAFLYGEDVREVEYIESTGTQYIDTGVLKEPNTIVSARIYSAFPAQQQFFGTFADSKRFSIQVNTNLLVYPYAGTGISTNFKTTKDEWHDYTVDSGGGTYTFDGTSGSIAGATSFSTTIPIFVFCRNQQGTANTLSAFRLASLKIWHGSTLVRDFIPYRIGNKGCLYDRVSGKFFTNAGTGDFTAGPDALNPTTTSKAVYDAKVEYIESTGTQFIDTGIVPDGKGTSVECVFSNSVNGNFSPILWTRGANATDRAYCFEVEKNQQARWDYADYGAIQMANTVPLNEKVTLTIKDGTATVNGVQMTRASKEFTGAGPMILCNFCNYVNGERQMLSFNANPVRIYSFKVFSDGLLVRDFIPVRKDGRGCLYDLVTGRLFENAGTGAFLYGGDK